MRAAEQDRPAVAEARDRWREGQPKLNPASLVFIDEPWITTNMTRRYGWAPKGERLVDAVPPGHWKTSTFIGALRCDGLVAPAVFDGAINGGLFVDYVEQVLMPTLKPGDLVIMDNLRCHKVKLKLDTGNRELADPEHGFGKFRRTWHHAVVVRGGAAALGW